MSKEEIRKETKKKNRKTVHNTYILELILYVKNEV